MGGKARILLVDDDADILTVLAANLKLYGYEPLTASTLAEADLRISEAAPELVVLDRMLPDGDGADLCTRWRAEGKRLPVIMLTARDSVSDRVMGLECGADDYVIKPFEPMELVARIKACLRRTAAPVPAERERIVAGALAIDRASMRVTVGGEPVELTPKEYQLLCLLVERKGQVLSREDIKGALWKGTKIYSWSRVIDVHIQHLRQKVEEDPANPRYIKTVLGTGYRFEE